MPDDERAERADGEGRDGRAMPGRSCAVPYPLRSVARSAFCSMLAQAQTQAAADAMPSARASRRRRACPAQASTSQDERGAVATPHSGRFAIEKTVSQVMTGVGIV